MFRISVTDEYGQQIVNDTPLDDFCEINGIELGEKIGLEAELWTNRIARIGGGAAPLFFLRLTGEPAEFA